MELNASLVRASRMLNTIFFDAPIGEFGHGDSEPSPPATVVPEPVIDLHDTVGNLDVCDARNVRGLPRLSPHFQLPGISLTLWRPTVSTLMHMDSLTKSLVISITASSTLADPMTVDQ